jgi:hypothetical protein
VVREGDDELAVVVA